MAEVLIRFVVADSSISILYFSILVPSKLKLFKIFLSVSQYRREFSKSIFKAKIMKNLVLIDHNRLESSRLTSWSIK